MRHGGEETELFPDFSVDADPEETIVLEQAKRIDPEKKMIQIELFILYMMMITRVRSTEIIQN